MLDHAATVDEAIAIFNEFDMHDFLGAGCTYHYQIADASGDTAIIEYANGETTVIRPDESETLVATNFWLSEGVDDPEGIGHDRYETAKSMLMENNYIVTEEEAMNILDATHLENADLHGYICSTLWSIVFNNTDKTFTVCAMYDFDNVYKFSVNQPMRMIE